MGGERGWCEQGVSPRWERKTLKRGMRIYEVEMMGEKTVAA